MFSYMPSLVKLKLCGMVHQESVSNSKVLYSVCVQDVRVSGSHSDMHKKLETFPMIFTRKLKKVKHRIEHLQKTISRYRLHNESIFPCKFSP